MSMGNFVSVLFGTERARIGRVRGTSRRRGRRGGRGVRLYERRVRTCWHQHKNAIDSIIDDKELQEDEREDVADVIMAPIVDILNAQHGYDGICPYLLTRNPY